MNITNEYRYFLGSNFARVNRLFVLIYSNKDDNAKRFQAQNYYLPKSMMKIYNTLINGKKRFDSDLKR